MVAGWVPGDRAPACLIDSLPMQLLQLARVVATVAMPLAPLLAQSSYAAEVVASTGSLGITAIAPEVTINDGRRVAFVATLIDPTNNQPYPAVFADLGAPNTTRNISTGMSSTYTPQIGPGLQINNSGLVVTRRFELIPSALGPIPTSYIETWNSNATNSRATLVYGEPIFGTFDGLYPHPSINNLGGIVFAALDQNQNYLGTLTSAGGFTVQLAVPLPKPQMADDNEFVMRVGTGSITKFPPAYFPNTVIASGAVGGFTTLGERPGVSDDGRVVAFSGDRGAGQGVFVSVAAAGARRILRIAGEGDGFVNFAMDQRIGAVAYGLEPRFRVAFLAERSGVRACFVVEGIPELDPLTNSWVATNRPSARAVAIGDSIGGQTITDIDLYDPINKVGDVACRVTFAAGGHGVVRARRSSIELYDGNEKRLRTGTDVTTDANLLTSGGNPRRGLAADGTARLVARVQLPLPGQVTFQIVGANGATEYGSIYPCGSPATTTSTTVPTVASAQGIFAVACYRAPEDFVRAAFPGDTAAAQRDVVLRATFTPIVGPAVAYEVPITIVRPPLVLCHGLWSDEETWDSSMLLTDPRFEITKVDYRNTHARQYRVNAPLVRNYVSLARQRMARKELAAVRVDWVGHSMGGLLPRVFMAGGGYVREDNFSDGDLHKLVTLNTPHWGSPGANLLQTLGQSSEFTSFMDTIRMPIDQGAIDDLSEGSAALQAIGPTPNLAANPSLRLAVHAIGGSGGVTLANGATMTLSALSFLSPQPWGSVLRVMGALSSMVNTTLFRNQYHDLVVLLASQFGGVAPAANTTFTDIGSNHLGVTSHAGAAQRIVQLLNASVHASLFTNQIDPPNLNPPFTGQNLPAPPTMFAGAFTLSAPGAGATVAPGQSVQVVATPTSGNILTSVTFFGPDGSFVDVAQAPFQATFTVPAKAAVHAAFTALATLPGTGLAYLPTALQLPVGVPATLLGIELPLDRMTISDPTIELSVPVYGTYSDGIRRSLTGAASLTLTASPPGIVTAIGTGAIRASSPGVTMLTASYNGQSANCRVTVEFDPLGNYGLGTPGRGQIVPMLTGSGTPILGNQQFATSCSRLAGGISGWLVYSLAQARQPFLGGELLVDLTTAVAVFVTASGTTGQAGVGLASLSTPIPNQPALVGFTFYCQGVFLDPAAVNGVSSTPGLRISILP